MKVAIISCTSQLADRILVNTIKLMGKENVIGVCRSPEKMNAKNYEIEVRKGDFSDIQLLEKAFEGLEKVLLVSSNAKPGDRPAQHLNVINAAKKAGVKHFVYTSIIGVGKVVEEPTGFDAIVKSNHTTEEDIKKSGIGYTIGRNSLYLDPDVESLEMYRKEKVIQNCAGEGKVGYITREEMGLAYATILADKSGKFLGKTVNVCGKLVTQSELAETFNKIYGDLNLSYKEMTPKEYLDDRVKVYGEYFGGIIAGIYHLMGQKGFEEDSDFNFITGRDPQGILDGIKFLTEK